MATTTSKPVKKLGQFLEEQQEPFVLEIYLLEKGCLKNKKMNSDKSLKRSESCSSKSNTSKNGIIPQCPKLFKVVYNKLVSINGSSLKIKNNDKRDGEFKVTEEARNDQRVAESDQFSSASSTTVFNSCSESDAEEATTSHQPFRICNPEQKEAETDRDQWRHIEESKQISPVSVLEGIPSNNSRHDLGTSQEENNPSKSCFIVTKKISDDSILSASLWNLFFHTATEKPSSAGAAEYQDLTRNNPNSGFLKSKRVFEQTKQLLFDCVREAVETQQHGKEKSQQNRRENLESELLGKLICEKIKAWRRQSGGRLNITKQLESDYQDSAQEWNNFEPQIKDIAMEIGDAILEEIRDQIVTEMVYFNQI
ncbi:hypothetical protein Ddye_006629 [Dipteronia dyeriana]|uniref:DUF4378 domain-containing protein n=1 Tax=Dipteronia dyeriana TaxID=168575 RepID=A0AAD9XIZ6_9ROSI|nr:hypothetical protein Ddye_006629 [Dipteronia dyeriana]